MNSSATARLDLRRVTDKDLIELIHATEPATLTLDEMKTSLKLLRKDNRATVLLIKRLLHTGTQTARATVAATMRDSFLVIDKAYKTAGTNEYWQYQCDTQWNPTLRNTLTKRWNLANVMEEVSAPLSEDEVISAADSAVHGMKSSGYPMAMTENTNAYWRGVAALALSKVVHRNDRSLRQRAQSKARYDFYGQVDEFLEWAGTHPDINAVISTAKERKTIVVSDLAGIIRQE